LLSTHKIPRSINAKKIGKKTLEGKEKNETTRNPSKLRAIPRT
jgi:hypothetical protein